jgi:hypothetical protein
MNVNDVKPGLKVRITKLGQTTGYMVEAKHLTWRREGEIGTVGGYIPGHGGDCYWVDHDDGTVGAYAYDEFEPIEPIMKNVKPITPAEVTDKKLEVIPDGVIEAFNELITENWDGRSSTFTQKAVTQRIKEKMKHSFDTKWLDIEPLFEAIGWDIKYDKDGYEWITCDATFTFKKRGKKVLRG